MPLLRPRVRSVCRLLGCACLATIAGAQELPEYDTLVVTPELEPGGVRATEYQRWKIDSEILRRRAYRTTPQLLRDVPGVLVQETSYGQGSPFLRGFTGPQTVFFLDGVRLNNSVFRAGPNQYVNTVDPLSLDRVEVVMGPASVGLAADAIGGSIQAFTRDPYAWELGRPQGAVTYRVGSAESGHQVRLEGSVALAEQTSILVGGNFKTFGDLEGGRDVGVQPNTGYDEWDVDAKLEHYTGERSRLVFAHNQVHQLAVPRTHRTVFASGWEGTSVGSDLKRDLDQDRHLTYLQWHAEDVASGVDGLHLNASWQVQEEARDRIRGDGRRDLQGFEVGTLGLWARAETRSSWGDWSYGVEWYRDFVDSFRVSLDDPANVANGIQGPVADNATYDLLAAFVEDRVELDENWDATIGARAVFAAVDADSVRDPITDAETSLDDDWSGLVGNARLNRSLREGWDVYGGVSQGFRPPNLSDLTRFDSARTDEFEVPSRGLDAEHSTNFELGTRAVGRRGAVQFGVFHTLLRDAIQRTPTGATTAEGDAIVAQANTGDGEVTGVELAGNWALDEAWTVLGRATWIEGEVDTFPTSGAEAVREPLDRSMPIIAAAGLRWQQPAGDFWSELLVTWTDRADRLSTRDRNDTSRIPAGGTPGSTIVDLRGGWRISSSAELTLGAENLMDEDYRSHGSGINRPGFNLLATLRLTF